MAVDRSQADRLKELIEVDYHMTPADFVKKWGCQRAQTLYNVLQYKNNLTNKLLDKICNAYTEINRAWILTGQGEKFIDTTQGPYAEQRAKDAEIARLHEIIASQQRTIELLSKQISQ